MPENETEAKQTKDQMVEPIRGEVLARLQAIGETYAELGELFAGVGDEKSSDYYSKKKAAVLKMAGWYDPDAKKRAKIDRLKDQLLKLEEELAAEG